MTNSEDEKKTGTDHAPGSQPSVRPGSDQAQTIPAPTPPVAQETGPPKPSDLADVEDTSESRTPEEEPPADG